MSSEPSSAKKAGSESELLRHELDCANKKLAEAHKMASLGRLSAGIVHEINTPIGSVLSNNETVRRTIDALRKIVIDAADKGVQLPPKMGVLLESLSNLSAVDKIACERIIGIVRSLKTFARVNESDLHKVQVQELINATIKLTLSMYRRRIKIETDYAELPDIECYPGLLNQVFLNLIVNAAQAIEGEGTITVRTRREEDDRVMISISDTGKGIPPEVQPRIFAAGFTTKPLGEGTGLGLSITREIIQDTHHGSISYETEAGQGTTFFVRLPLKQPRNTSEQEQA